MTGGYLNPELLIIEELPLMSSYAAYPLVLAAHQKTIRSIVTGTPEGDQEQNPLFRMLFAEAMLSPYARAAFTMSAKMVLPDFDYQKEHKNLPYVNFDGVFREKQ